PTPSSRKTRSSPARRATRPTYSARLARSNLAPIRAASCQCLLVVARRLDALPCGKGVDGLLMHTQDAADPNGIEPPVVDQPADRLRMDAELPGDLADAVEHVRLRIDRRHDSPQALHATAARAVGHSAQ